MLKQVTMNMLLWRIKTSIPQLFPYTSVQYMCNLGISNHRINQLSYLTNTYVTY